MEMFKWIILVLFVLGGFAFLVIVGVALFSFLISDTIEVIDSLIQTWKNSELHYFLRKRKYKKKKDGGLDE